MAINASRAAARFSGGHRILEVEDDDVGSIEGLLITLGPVGGGQNSSAGPAG